MIKKILAAMVMMYAAVSFAAVDVNKATAAELDSIKGIGPAISAKILEEKKKGGNFKDWNDLVTRVNGVGEANAAKFSSEGLTVGGASYKGAPAAPAAKKDEKPAAAKDAKDAKPAAKAEEKKADAKPNRTRIVVLLLELIPRKMIKIMKKSAIVNIPIFLNISIPFSPGSSWWMEWQ